MQENRCFSNLETGVERFMEHLKRDLSKEDLELVPVSSPQAVKSFCLNGNNDLQLRFVVFGQSDGTAIGRLSWLDKSGSDHVCCYLNEEFENIRYQKNGGWAKQQDRVSDVCVECLLDIVD